MSPLAEIETRIEHAVDAGATPQVTANELLALGEAVLEHWVVGRGEVPTTQTREGFRLLALQRQGARGEPSFNACRETCRELAFHYNLVLQERDEARAAAQLRMMSMVATHIFLFVAGKLEVAGLGDFCCSSRPAHATDA